MSTWRASLLLRRMRSHPWRTVQTAQIIEQLSTAAMTSRETTGSVRIRASWWAGSARSRGSTWVWWRCRFESCPEAPVRSVGLHGAAPGALLGRRAPRARLDAFPFAAVLKRVAGAVLELGAEGPRGRLHGVHPVTVRLGLLLPPHLVAVGALQSRRREPHDRIAGGVRCRPDPRGAAGAGEHVARKLEHCPQLCRTRPSKRSDSTSSCSRTGLGYSAQRQNESMRGTLVQIFQVRGSFLDFDCEYSPLYQRQVDEGSRAQAGGTVLDCTRTRTVIGCQSPPARRYLRRLTIPRIAQDRGGNQFNTVQ